MNGSIAAETADPAGNGEGVRRKDTNRGRGGSGARGESPTTRGAGEGSDPGWPGRVGGAAMFATIPLSITGNSGSFAEQERLEQVREIYGEQAYEERKRAWERASQPRPPLRLPSHDRPERTGIPEQFVALRVCLHSLDRFHDCPVWVGAPKEGNLP